MKRAIGAIAIYENEHRGRTALLQVRSADDSFPGCVEKTWGGGAEDREKFRVALQREFGEELRELCQRSTSQGPMQLQELASNRLINKKNSEADYQLSRLNILRENGRKIIVTLLCRVDNLALIEIIQPFIEAGIIMEITASDLHRLIPINSNHKRKGISDDDRNAGKLGMFPDEIQAVTKALNPENI